MISASQTHHHKEFHLFGNERFIIRVCSLKTPVFQSIIWDSRKPMHFLGFEVNFNTQNQVITIINVKEKRKADVSVFDVKELGIEPNQSIYTSANLTISIFRIPAIPAPYLETKTVSHLAGILYISSGVKKFLIQYKALQQDGYIGYIRKNPAFILKETNGQYYLTPLLDSLFIHSTEDTELQPNSELILSSNDLSKLTIYRGQHWWKFNFISDPLASDSDFTKTIFNSERISEEASEKTWLKHFAVLTSAIGALSFLLLYQNSTPQKKIIPTPEPKEISVSVKKAKLIQKFAQAPAPNRVVQNPIVVKTAPKTTPPKPQTNKSFQRSKEMLTSALGGLSSGVSGQLTSTNAPNSLIHSAPNLPSSLNTSSPLELLNRESSLSGIAEKVDTGPVDSTSIKQSMGSGISDVGDENASFTDEGLTKDEIGRVVHSHISEVRYCYESASLRNSSLAGKVLIAFSVSPNGGVTTARVTSNETGEVALADCVVNKLKTWRFPKPRGGKSVNVSYPFTFKKIGMGGSRE